MVGTLLPFSSLVSEKYPNDKMAAARLFVDWLAATGQTVWQMLPISPSTDGISPYASAGLGIDPKLGTLEQFMALRDYAHAHGVELWGDIPFYLPAASPFVKKYPTAFLTNSPYVAGSYGTKHFAKQQVWGMLLYDFSSVKRTELVLQIWKERLEFLARIFDRVRIDAAIRFFKYEKISPQHPEIQRRVKGPGEPFFAELVKFSRQIGLEPYVEDISDFNMGELYRECAKLKIATISVFTLILAPGSCEIDPADFRFGAPSDHIYFTSTHDTPPVWPYLESLDSDQRIVIAKTFGLATTEPKEMAVAVVAKMREGRQNLVVALQDWLLDRTRINVPGSGDLGNWTYQMSVPVEDLPKKLI